MAWIPLKIGTKPKIDTLIANTICYASPEVYAYFNQAKYVLLKSLPKNTILQLLEVKLYEKNRVFVHNCPDDSTVFLRKFDTDYITRLTEVELNTSSEVNESLNHLNELLPNSENCNLVPIRNEQVLSIGSTRFEVKTCKPTSQGILTENTKITVLFEKENNEKRTEDVVKVFRYSCPFFAKIDNYHEILFSSMQRNMLTSYVLQVSEIPSDLAQKLIEDASDFDYLTSNVAFIHHHCDKATYGRFNFLPGGKTLYEVPILLCQSLPKGQMFFTPFGLQNYGIELDSRATFPMLKKISSKKVKEADEVHAIPIKLYSAVSEEDYDKALSNFFEKEKIVSFSEDGTSLVEVPFTKSSCKSINVPKRIEFELKISKHESNAQGSHFRISTKTKLIRSSICPRSIPPITKTYSPTSTRYNIMNVLPDFIMVKSKKIYELLFDAKMSNILMYGHQGSGKDEVLKGLKYFSGLTLLEYDAKTSILSDSSGATEAKLRNVYENAKISSGGASILVLKNVHVLAKNRDGILDHRVLSVIEEILQEGNLKVIGEADVKSNVDVRLMELFDYSIAIENPDLAESRLEILEWLLQTSSAAYFEKSTLETISKLCPGFMFEDLKALADISVMNAHRRVDFVEDIHHSVLVTQSDLELAMEHVRNNTDAIGVPKIPQVQFQDVGGLSKQKQEILDLLVPLLNPELQQSGFGRSGILFFGKQI